MRPFIAIAHTPPYEPLPLVDLKHHLPNNHPRSQLPAPYIECSYNPHDPAPRPLDHLGLPPAPAPPAYEASEDYVFAVEAHAALLAARGAGSRGGHHRRAVSWGGNGGPTRQAAWASAGARPGHRRARSWGGGEEALPPQRLEMSMPAMESDMGETGPPPGTPSVSSRIDAYTSGVLPVYETVTVVLPHKHGKWGDGGDVEGLGAGKLSRGFVHGLMQALVGFCSDIGGE
ncbi:hypothetical protein HK101_000219 [Irineochytrium annulatum]|nr:hypothetical protein HK101_000219 [Irineochytrium annulatum]